MTATVTNTGSRAGSDVAQLYLADPSAAGEPPRQLAGYKRVTLAAGQSTQVKFKVTPQDEEWWDTSANGWSQSPGTYGVYVGDSSALADLPLQGQLHARHDGRVARGVGERSVDDDAGLAVDGDGEPDGLGHPDAAARQARAAAAAGLDGHAGRARRRSRTSRPGPRSPRSSR